MTRHRVIVCRVGQDPVVEYVPNVFTFVQVGVLKGGYIEQKELHLNSECLVAMWDEDAPMKKLPLNRNVPARSFADPAAADFVIDQRDPTKDYAGPGELGYFEVFGNFVISKVDEDGEYTSLTDEEVQALTPLLELRKCEWCGANVVAYPGAKYCGAACSAESEIHK